MVDQAPRKGRFWFGPITDKKQAGLIIAWAAWPAIVVGAGGTASSLSRAIGDLRTVATDIILVVIIVLPAIILLTRKSRVAAIWLFAIIGLCTLAALAAGVYGVATIGVEGIFILALSLLYVVYTVVLWRSVRATFAWPRVSTIESFA